MYQKVKSRIKQGLIYIFGKYDTKWNFEIKNILSSDEFFIYFQMDKYDKIHSYKILKKIEINPILSNEKIYFKLALLHDCGKEKIGLLKRIKKVLIGDKILEMHELKGYIKLKEINLELANLVRTHHSQTNDLKMTEFQKLDDE